MMIGGTIAVNLVLVAVVYLALAYGAVTGMLAGTIGGLVQDALAGGIVGIGGMSKTIIGFVVGVLGAQFNLSSTVPRLVMFVAATFVHEVVFEGLHAMVGGAAVRAAVVGDADPGAGERPGRRRGVPDRGARARRRCSAGAWAAGRSSKRTVLNHGDDQPDARRSPQPDHPAVGHAIPRGGGLRRAGRRLLDLPDRPAREVPRDRREQPPAQAAAAGAARRAARSPRQGAGREPEHAATSRWCASRPRTFADVLRVLAVATGGRRSAAARHGQPPPPRADLPPDRADRERHAASRSSRSWARRLELPGIIYQEVPSRKYPASDMAAHLFGYVGEVTEAQLQREDYEGVEPGTIVGQAGVELAYNKHADGQGRQQDGRRQQRRPRDSTSCDNDRRRRSAARCSSRSTPTCRRRPRTVSPRAASTAPRWCSIRGTVKCLRSPAGRPTIRTRSPPASIARPGRRSTAIR